jgi:hypothetical protein
MSPVAQLFDGDGIRDPGDLSEAVRLVHIKTIHHVNPQPDAVKQLKPNA